MTATDELRRMLDGRGVEWAPDKSGRFEVTRWRDRRGAPIAAVDDGFVDFLFDFYWQPTPAQAIEATLGRGTCRNTQSDFDFMCSECGKCVDNGRVLGFNYCPRCGRKVVE